jgi:hypothetical protein
MEFDHAVFLGAVCPFKARGAILIAIGCARFRENG